MLKIVKIRHAWPEKANFSINRPAGTYDQLKLLRTEISLNYERKWDIQSMAFRSARE